MKPEHKKYILDNIGKKSIKEIAEALGIRERNVKKYLDARGVRGDRPSPRLYAALDESPVASAKPVINIILIICIIALVFAVYSNALQNSFIWDDEFLVRDNTAIESLANAASIFGTYLAATSGNINSFYRPTQELSYMTDYRLWGGRNPFGFHLTNIVLHAACAVLLFMLLSKILKNQFAAFAAAALFGVHPINTEAITYIAGRADSLYVLFFLASFVLFLKSADSLEEKNKINILFYIFSLSFYLFSILSKEVGLILPIFLLLYIFALAPRSSLKNRLYILSVPYAATALIYIVIRRTILDFSHGAPSFAMAKFSLPVRLLTTCKAICIYLSLLIAPFGLHMERKIATMPSLHDGATIGAILMIIILASMVWLFYKYSKRFFFAGMWFFIGLIPVSNIVPINSFIAEHWLYLPAIGIFIIAGIGIADIFYKGYGKPSSGIWKAIAVSALAAMLIFFGTLTFARNREWKDSVTFFKNTIKYSPNNARLHLNFGNTYVALGQDDNAMMEYKKALDLEPDYAEAYSNIGSIYMDKGDYTEARKYIEKALSIKPNIQKAQDMLRALKEG